MRRYFESFYDAMDDIGFDLRSFEDLGDGRVMIDSKLMARGKTTGIAVEQDVVLVWELRDGLAYRCHVFASREAAQAAFGG
jgi:ketosteroid isomerase-like protein